jgi:O-antigen/teichoic acid export membrane protein
MATLLVVTRMLGPRDFGAFAAIAALALILGAFSTFGSQLVLLGETARDPRNQQAILRYAVPTTLLGGVAMFALYLTVTPFLIGQADIAIHVLVAIGITETLLQPLFSLPATQHLALGRIARSQLLTLVPLALRMLAAAGVWILAPHAPLTAYAYAYLAASVLALGLATATMPVAWPSPASMRLPKRKEFRAMAGYAALAISGTAPTELDKSLAARLMPLEAAGTYAAAGRIVGATTLPVTAMILSALPRLFRESTTETTNHRHLHHSLFGAAITYSLILAATLWIIAPSLDGVFGPAYQGVGETLRLLSLAIPGMALRHTAGNVLMASARAWTRFGIEIAGLHVLVLFAFILVPAKGPTAMPLALATAEWMMALMGFAAVMRSKIKP